jgi:hypothetical protein
VAVDLGRAGRLIARHHRLLGHSVLVRRISAPLADEDPWDAIERLRLQVSADEAYGIVLAPDLASTAALATLLEADGGHLGPFAERAVRLSLARDPFGLKAPMLRIAAGGNREILRYVTEIAMTLNDSEARQLFAGSVGEALAPVDPYGEQDTTWALETVSALLPLYPPLVDELLAAAGADPVKRAVAGDAVVMAASRQGLIGYRELPRVAPLIAERLLDVPERFRPADNRYSTSDSVRRLATLGSRRWSDRLASIAKAAAPQQAGFRTRLAAFLGLDIIGIGVLDVASRGLTERGVTLPSFGLSEGLTAVGILVALHVLSVELGAGSLPAGVGPAVTWPARLVSAYSVLSVVLAAAMFPSLFVHLRVAAVVVLLAHVPFVAGDLISKSDARRAAFRISRDRQRDFTNAGTLSGETYQAAAELAALLEEPNQVRRATTEPVTRNRLRITADRNGYLLVDVDRIRKIGGLLAHSDKSPLRSGSPAPALVLLRWPGNEVVAGDVLAVLEVDEPESARLLMSSAKRAFTSARLDTAERAIAAATALASILEAQLGGDLSGARRTSRYLERAVTEFTLAGSAVVPATLERRGYMQRLLPFDPAFGVVHRFELAWRRTTGTGDVDRDTLRQHALRLASTRSTSPYASSLDMLIARLGTVASDMPVADLHGTAALLSELGGIAAETAGHDSFFPARNSLESMLDRLVQTDPIPREERLVRQRFEELLARALVADYFLETDVERGCEKLSEMAKRATSTGRCQDILVGICKLGGLALDYGRVALSAKLVILVVGAPVDWTLVRALISDESYGIRLSALSQFAGEVFGTDVPASVSRFADWAQALSAAFPGGVLPATSGSSVGAGS